MIIAIYLFIIGSITLILWGVTSPMSEIRFKLPQGEGGSRTKMVKTSSFLSRIFPFTPNILRKLKLEAKLKNRLLAAHLRLTPQDFFNLKLILIVLLGILIFFVSGKLDPTLLLVAIGTGYIIPDLFVNKRIANRKNMIAKSLPETVDLLGLCVEAGLDFTSAVRWLIKKVASNPMIEELTFVLEEIQWGKPRIQALKDMSRRLNISEVTSFVQALVQAERMGTPVSEAFGILSEDTRMQRFHRGERYAMQAPIKILIPLIFCILPVIGIVIGGPIFLQFMQGKLF